MKKEIFEFNGYTATVLTPDTPNGKWIWKTEFFEAFDNAERALCDMGYTRVYYQISDMYGSDKAIRLMHAFHIELLKRYNLQEKPVLFGFSRGGLYAFNYALYYPEYVDKIYLDAPVLNLKSWPPKDSKEYFEMLSEYKLNAESYNNFRFSPIDNLEEFSKNNIPLLVVAGLVDSVVPVSENCGILVEYYKKCNVPFTYLVKENCGHHPHGLDDFTPILDFVKG